MKKSLVLLFTIFLCVMNGACLTSKLYGAKKPPLNETITGFLVTEDQKQLILVGQHYHYIFPLPDDLRSILAWSGRGKLEASNLSFTISRGNIINGSYRLYPIDPQALSDDDRNVLLADHFSLSFNNNLLYDGRLSQGHVYDSGHFQLPAMVAFKSPYHLVISYDYASVGQTAGAILLTPLSIAADGVITVTGVVIGIPVALVMFSSNGSQH